MTELFNSIPDPTDAILFWGILVISFLLSFQIMDKIMGDDRVPSMFWIGLFILWGGTLTFVTVVSLVLLGDIF
jgi:hypothetical protein|tara:strand:- start:2189 stop:2407 length:219 start_codon:yes stop_codon:yes gene_type:complete